MSLPTRKQQIDAVAKFLDAERNEGRSLEEIAAEIVDGYLDMLLSAVKKPATPLRAGMLIKSPVDGKTRYIAWLDDERGEAWVVHETSSYGWYGPTSPPLWAYCEEYRPKRRVVIEGKGRMVEMTDAEIAEAWDNPDWKVGDKASLRQRIATFEVVAVGPQCVLMRDLKSGVLQVDSNRNLGQYYHKEAKW